MGLYTYEDSDEVSNHVDSGDGEITTVEIDGELFEQIGGMLRAAEAPITVIAKVQRGRRITVVCSCGSRTCSEIGRYGHPEPLYQSAIEPIPGQHARDVKALALKA